MPARTAHNLRPANSDHGAGNSCLRHSPFYSKSLTVIIHSVTPPTYTGSSTRGCSLEQRPLITFHVPPTVPLMSAIKAGHVRDTSVIRVLAPPPLPAAAVCACLMSAPLRPRFATDPGSCCSRPSCAALCPRAQRTSELSSSADVVPQGRQCVTWFDQQDYR